MELEGLWVELGPLWALWPWLPVELWLTSGEGTRINGEAILGTGVLSFHVGSWRAVRRWVCLHSLVAPFLFLFPNKLFFWWITWRTIWPVDITGAQRRAQRRAALRRLLTGERSYGTKLSCFGLKWVPLLGPSQRVLCLAFSIFYSEIVLAFFCRCCVCCCVYVWRS